MQPQEKPSSAFDDRSLPFGKVNPERSDAIEKIMLPQIEAELEKLRLLKPQLFRSLKSE